MNLPTPDEITLAYDSTSPEMSVDLGKLVLTNEDMKELVRTLTEAARRHNHDAIKFRSLIAAAVSYGMQIGIYIGEYRSMDEGK
jgi:hypothetical protein